MNTEKPKRSLTDIVFANPISVAGAVGLFVDLIGLSTWAERVIVGGDVRQLGWRFLVLVILFAFATSLIVWGSKFTKLDARKVIQVYAYTYSVLAAISYVGVAYVLNSGSYDKATYGGFWLVVMGELTAFFILRFISKARDRGWFAVPLITAALWHYTLMVWTYIMRQNTVENRVLLENIAFAIAMTVAASFIYLQSDLPGSLRYWRAHKTTLRDR